MVLDREPRESTQITGAVQPSYFTHEREPNRKYSTADKHNTTKPNQVARHFES